jgi:hypothetical protein
MKIIVSTNIDMDRKIVWVVKEYTVRKVKG